MLKSRSSRPCILLVVAALAVFTPSLVFAADHATKVYGHRGMVQQYPENTMAAFKACVDKGVSIELDVYLTKDGVPVVIHDATVDRTTNGSGEVMKMTLREIKALDAGSWYNPKFKSEKVPTLGEVFDMISSRDKDKDTYIAINMKKLSKGIEHKIVSLAERFRMVDRVFAFGMDSKSTERLKIGNADFPVGRGARTQEDLEAAVRTTYLDYIWLTPQAPYMPARESVQAAQKSRKRVLVYIRQNEPDRWKAAHAAGVDAIATDYPVEAKKLLGL
jgi:glycerophosphoryl diester phosphodiesterase